MPALSPADVDRLRAALLAADFTVAAVAELIGPQAHQALARNETTPGLRRTRDRSPLSTLTRLWPLQAPVAAADADAALPGLVDSLCVGGLLERSVGEVRAVVDVRPYADDDDDWWVVSDLTPGLDGADRRMSSDHVLGVSAASTSLAHLTIREPLETALDLGTGSGVQALHLSRHVDHVVATDVNARCLELAGIGASLNQVSVELRSGSLYEPVAHDRFDLIVTNPPFVISPGTSGLLTYRDSGLPGDEVVRQVVTGSVGHLRPGGWCQVLANWVHVDAQPWQERLAGWVAETRCDAWVVQREVVDPSRYVEMWLDDAGLRGCVDYHQRYDAWVGWFEASGVSAIGFGWLNLRRADRAEPAVTIEEWPYDVEQPLGPHVRGWGARVDHLAGVDDKALLARRFVRAPDLVEERLGTPGAEHPTSIVVRSQRGLRRARRVSTEVAGMIGACDGDLTLGEIADALATLLERPRDDVRGELAEAARGLVLDGALDLPGA